MEPVSAADEVVDICRDLLRIDTSNTGDPRTTVGERVAAEYVAAQLSDVGIDVELLESAPRRANLVARIPGVDRSRGALLVHGHLDVVPFDESEWSVHPLSGSVQDGYVWGRGAVDMKDMDAMILAVVRQRLREGRRPERDVVLMFTADEEAGGEYGAKFLVEEHPGYWEVQQIIDDPEGNHDWRITASVDLNASAPLPPPSRPSGNGAHLAPAREALPEPHTGASERKALQ